MTTPIVTETCRNGNQLGNPSPSGQTTPAPASTAARIGRLPTRGSSRTASRSAAAC
jgi:hypothetical protein